MCPQRQKLQHDLSSSYPRIWKSGYNSSDGQNTPLISENLPVPASPSVIRTTGAHHSRDTTGYASYLPGLDFPDSPYNNANECSYPSPSSIGPPYQHVLPPMNLIPSFTGFSQCGSSSSSESFVCEILPIYTMPITCESQNRIYRLTSHCPTIILVLRVLHLHNLITMGNGGFLRTRTGRRLSIRRIRVEWKA